MGAQSRKPSTVLRMILAETATSLSKFISFSSRQTARLYVLDFLKLRCDQVSSS